MTLINDVKHYIVLGLVICLGACATSAPVLVPPSYNAKALAEKWRANQGSSQKPELRHRPKVKGKVFYVIPSSAEEGDPNLQDNDTEISRNKYSYPVYQPDEDNPYVYSPSSPTNYPADNDADYYYYPLYFSE